MCACVCERVSINTLRIQETSGDHSLEINRPKGESGHFPPSGSPVTPLVFQLMNNYLLLYEGQLCLLSLSEMWSKSVQTLHHCVPVKAPFIYFHQISVSLNCCGPMKFAAHNTVRFESCSRHSQHM